MHADAAGQHPMTEQVTANYATLASPCLCAENRGYSEPSSHTSRGTPRPHAVGAAVVSASGAAVVSASG
eukprot:CAMPEP_0177468210 /NCGR_PEP_ID=MMETSP0369-20130122/18943_1 /TAXON_ID=447022 ORGANISM="Scrippsiella hangoei-like, Strain SHHI-4" /NCGR_SAMPLE_ID=MMETSP0369 /ASSEMBLY_ACC=CAM_ASM_000364 /LENGTH=68 /DNA_ID=CAMNT_0018942381 /DNA_START=29 /DNA_END=232 /DNA_ORIENTATION=-